MKKTIFNVTSLKEATRVIGDTINLLVARRAFSETTRERDELARQIEAWNALSLRVMDMRFTGPVNDPMNAADRAYFHACQPEIFKLATRIYEVDAMARSITYHMDDNTRVVITATPEGYHVQMQMPRSSSMQDFGVRQFHHAVGVKMNDGFICFLGDGLPIRDCHKVALEALRATIS